MYIITPVTGTKLALTYMAVIDVNQTVVLFDRLLLLVETSTNRMIKKIAFAKLFLNNRC